MIVTIDGPAGAGKSTIAKALAERLGFEYLDTGAMYRVVALAGLRQDIDWTDTEQLPSFLQELKIQVSPGQVLLNGENVTTAIRTPEVTAISGKVASIALVRERLVLLQRETAAHRDMICEGRDQGTVVFPDAVCKVFLTATPEERARRRFEELKAKGTKTTYEEVLRAQIERDKRDAERDVGPMVPAADAKIIDSSDLTQEQVIHIMEQEVRQCRTGSPISGTNSPTS